jgi:hypothetical protein
MLYILSTNSTSSSRFLEADTWNVLGNYAKTPLVLIGDEAQLRLVMLSTSDDNEFVYSMKLFLFHRLKLLRHSFVMLNVQYRMIDIMRTMISNLLYERNLVNDSDTDLSSRSLTQSMIQYVQRRWNVRSSILLLNVKSHKQRNTTKSSFNLVNASVMMELAVDLLDKGIVILSTGTPCNKIRGIHALIPVFNIQAPFRLTPSAQRLLFSLASRYIECLRSLSLEKNFSRFRAKLTNIHSMPH